MGGAVGFGIDVLGLVSLFWGGFWVGFVDCGLVGFVVLGVRWDCYSMGCVGWCLVFVE